MRENNDNQVLDINRLLNSVAEISNNASRELEDRLKACDINPLPLLNERLNEDMKNQLAIDLNNQQQQNKQQIYSFYKVLNRQNLGSTNKDTSSLDYNNKF